MKDAFNWVLVLALGLPAANGSAAERELIQDNHFQRGFTLWEPKPGRHVRYGELSTGAPPPVWGLSQWSSRFPIAENARERVDGLLVWSNSAKVIRLGAGLELSLGANSGVEYGPRARVAADPWVHLLVDQEFAPTAPLAELKSARLHVEARLLRSRNLHRDDYSPGTHAAQFQIFLTVQNRNRQSRGHGDLLWFGIPIYDNRHRFPEEFKAQDFGGTAKFIFTPGGQSFTRQSTHDGQWVVIDQDVLPLMREALALAWRRGFLKDSKAIEDYQIGGMNMGWELPGSFDVEMQVRNLSLKVADKDPGAASGRDGTNARKP